MAPSWLYTGTTTHGLNTAVSEHDAAAGVLAAGGYVAELQAAFVRVVQQFQLHRIVRQDHLLELQRVDGAELRRQVEILAAIADRPFDLHDAGQYRRAGEMAVEIKQVG